MSEAALSRPVETGSAIRVLIVDDSAVARAALSRMIDEHPEFEVVAALDGARRAIDWLRGARADIVLLDLEMPGLDGHAALPELLEVSRGARVLVVSSAAAEGAAATVRALALGATDTLAKPTVGGLGRHFAATLIDKMLGLGEVALRPVSEVQLDGANWPTRASATGPIACVAIGASTGGLHALAALFAALPRGFDAPILITQHLPPVFMPFFADQLATISGRAAHVAVQGAEIRHGEIVIAPGEAHLGCIRRHRTVRVDLLTHEVASRCRPSVDPMLACVAESYGAGAVGIVLSGMGRDGAVGAGALAAQGGTLIVQDSATSAVWGMPGTIARAGLASLIAPPRDLAASLARRGVAR